MTSGAFRINLRVDSEVTQRHFSAQFAFRVCHCGASEASPTSDRRQKSPLIWLMVHPIRIVLLIANGSPPMEATIFEAELCFRVGRRLIFLRDASKVLP